MKTGLRALGSGQPLPPLPRGETWACMVPSLAVLSSQPGPFLRKVYPSVGGLKCALLGPGQCLPSRALGAPLRHHPRKEHSGTEPGRGRSAGSRARWPECKEIRRGGQPPVPGEPPPPTAPTARGSAGGAAPPVAALAPLAHFWKRPGAAEAEGQSFLLRRRCSRQEPVSGEAPRHPHPRGARGTLTWRTARCHAPAGCGSPPASSAGSARAPGAPCWPGDAGREAGTLGARAPSPHVPRHLRGDAGHSAPPTAPAPQPGGV